MLLLPPVTISTLMDAAEAAMRAKVGKLKKNGGGDLHVSGRDPQSANA